VNDAVNLHCLLARAPLPAQTRDPVGAFQRAAAAASPLWCLHSRGSNAAYRVYINKRGMDARMAALR